MGKIDAWIPKIPRLKNAKVSRFSYKNAAYTNDDIEGFENYDYTRDMNVPTLNKTDTENSVLDSGARAQFSSLSKNALNHFFGRVSYNLNKVIDFLSDFLDDFIEFQSTNETQHTTINNTLLVQGTETIQYTSNSNLASFYAGKKVRLINITTSNYVITLQGGRTYKGTGTINLAAYSSIELELIGNSWIEVVPYGTTIETYVLSTNEAFTLPAMTTGKKFRLANVSPYTLTINRPLASSITMNNKSTFTIAAKTILEFELQGTKLYCMSNEWEPIWINSTPNIAFTGGVKNTNISMTQFRYLVITYRHATYSSETKANITRYPATSAMETSQPLSIRRSWSVDSATSLYFDVGEVAQTYNNYTREDSYMIPLVLYGIK